MKKHFKNLYLGVSCLLPLSAFASDVPFIIDGSIKGGNNRNYAQIGAFAPITSSDQNLIFGDVRYMHHLPKTGKKKKNSLYSEKSYEANFGLGYRQVIDDESIAGGALYYDIRNAKLSKALFSQITLNFHFLTPTWQTHANMYVPVGKKKVTKTDTQFTGKGKVLDRDIFFIYDENKITEKSLPGGDFRISRNIPGLENLRVGSLFYYFKDKKSIAGGGIDLTYDINENVKFETSYTYDRVRKSNVLAGFRFSMPVGKIGKGRAIDKLMTTRVERDLDIVTNQNNEPTIQKNIQQTNMLAIRKNDLSDVTSATSANQSLNVLSKLESVYDNNGTIILANDGEEFEFAKVDKLAGGDLKKQVTNEQTSAAKQLGNNVSVNDVLDSAQKETNPLLRQAKILGAQKANQTITKTSGFHVGGKMRLNIQKDLDRLFAKYATKKSAGNSTFTNVPFLNPNDVVERAGAMILLKENGQVYTIVATDKANKKLHKNDGVLPYNTWFGGAVDVSDANVSETVMRETFEESAGSVYISQQDFDDAISDNRFFYSPHYKILTIVYPDVNGLYNVSDFTKNLNRLNQNPNVVNSMKESASYHKVHISQIVNLHQRMQNPPQNRRDAAYNVQDINGIDLRIESHYAKNLGASRNGLGSIIKTIGKL